MLTRFEKYKSYREEIAKINRINSAYLSNQKEVAALEERINKISPNILFKDEIEYLQINENAIDFSKAISALPYDFSSFLKITNDLKIIESKQKYKQMITRINDQIIIDNKGNVSHDWLLKNDQYLSLIKIKQRKDLFEESNINSLSELKNKYTLLDNQDHNVCHKITPLKLPIEKQKMKTVFLFVTYTMIAIIAIVVIITLIKLIKW